MISGLILFSTFLLWLLASACIPHLDKKATAPTWRKILCWTAYVYDVIYSTTIGTLLFWEWPAQHKTVIGLRIYTHRLEPLTTRLKRHYRVGGYRGNLARILCGIIDRIPGGTGHCR